MTREVLSYGKDAGPWKLIGPDAKTGDEVLLAEIVVVPTGTLRIWQIQAGAYNYISDTWVDLQRDYEFGWTPTHWMTIPAPGAAS